MAWPELSLLLNWNATWVFVWAAVNMFFTIMLFWGKGNGIYKAMQAYLALTTVLIVRTGFLLVLDVTNNPGPYYMASIIMALLAPAGALSSIYLAYKVWKAKRS